MRLGLVLAALLSFPLAAPAPAVAPDAPWWLATALDSDGDRIDDALPRSGGPVLVLVAFPDVPGDADVAALRGAGFEPLARYARFDVVLVEARPDRFARLLEVPGVVLVERDAPLWPLLRESVPMVGAPEVWRTGATGKGVTVAVLDDGSFEQHPDFEGKVVASFDASAPSTGVGAAAPAQAPLLAAGTDGHGTHVAGTIVGPGTQSGGAYKGVAPDARFANVKVFRGPNSTSSSIVLQGLDWTLANADRYGIKVASLSLGGAPSDGRDALSRAVDRAVDDGLIVVAAAGNEGPGRETVGTPGAAERAITVGAVDKRKAVAPYSSRGPTLDGRLKPEIVAPGTGITSTVPPASTTVATRLASGDRQVFYGQLSGTSMAAPHVAGVVALMLEVDPDLEPFEVKQILVATAQDLGPKGRDNDTGYGFVNAIAAVRVAREPGLLDSPELAAVLETLPPPREPTWLERAQLEVEEAQRAGRLPLYVAVAAGALALIALVVVLVRRR